jgi:RHS repeat-associated protein
MKKIRLYKNKIISAFLVVVLVVSSGLITILRNPAVNVHYELSAQQADFLDTLQQAYALQGLTATFSEANNKYLVLDVAQDDGAIKKYLFDTDTQRVVKSNFTGSLNTKNKNVVFASASMYDAENQYVYNANNKLIELVRPNMTYSYEYDEFGNVSNRYIDGERLNIFAYNTVDVEVFSKENSIEIGILVEEDIAERPVVRAISTPNYKFTIEYEYQNWNPTPMQITEENYLYYYSIANYDTKIKSMANDFWIFSYEYKDNNIKTYTYGDNVFTYNYNNQNELVKYSINGDTTDIIYDFYGNILSAGIDNYTYGSGRYADTLLSFNGIEFVYNKNGAPTQIGENILSWDGGNLATYNNIEYVYDADGVRRSKTIDGVTTNYYTDYNKVLLETNGTDIIEYLWDCEDIIGMVYNNTPYYYVKNAQQDVVGIANKNGNLIVEYLYDPWGAILSIRGELADTIGRINPYRYRSYRYDEEIGLYYLTSRYYSPILRRFISADDPANHINNTLADDFTKNLYAYCNNNPIMNYDPEGKMAVAALNALRSLYSDAKVMGDSYIGAIVTALNGGNIYQGFHETAQLVAAKRLSQLGYTTQLEYRCNAGEIDIVANGHIIYEVKPYNATASTTQAQIAKYRSATGFSLGSAFSEYKIAFFPKIYMYVKGEGNGLVTYTFYNEYSYKILWATKQVKNLITAERLNKAMAVAIWAAIIAAGAIYVGTGANPASLTLAATCFIGVMTIPLLFL